MALAERRDVPAFAPEVYSSSDLKQTAVAMRAHAVEQLRLLEHAMPRLDERRKLFAQRLLAQREDVLQQFDSLERLGSGIGRIRCHGDYHLGQVLVSEGDVIIIDFEGEPARPLQERRAKSSPLRDVAGMLRSFSYAALTGLGAATQTRREDVDRLAPWAELWERWIGALFLRAYLGATAGAAFLPPDSGDLDLLLHAFTVHKAMYELGYELNNRPEWVHIPLTGLLRFARVQALPIP